MSKADTTTIAASEAQLAPVVVTGIALSLAAELAVIVATQPTFPLLQWMALCATSLVPMAHNLQCLWRNGPSIGELPVALVSLLPASLAGTMALPRGSAAWWASLVTLLMTTAVAALLWFWVGRIRTPLLERPQIDQDAVIVVLGGLVRHGQPVPTVTNRLSVAADLWRNAPKRRILLTGGMASGGSVTEADAMAKWICAAEGVPREALLLERKALNTEQNLAFAQELIEREGLVGRQVCLVSSDYHLYRARELARRAGLTVTCVPAPVPLTSLPQQWCREVLVILAKL